MSDVINLVSRHHALQTLGKASQPHFLSVEFLGVSSKVPISVTLVNREGIPIVSTPVCPGTDLTEKERKSADNRGYDVSNLGDFPEIRDVLKYIAYRTSGLAVWVWEPEPIRVLLADHLDDRCKLQLNSLKNRLLPLFPDTEYNLKPTISSVMQLLDVQCQRQKLHRSPEQANALRMIYLQAQNMTVWELLGGTETLPFTSIIPEWARGGLSE